MNNFKAVRAIANHYSMSRGEVVGYLRDNDIEVMTYEQAEERAEDYITESLWAFNASFLLGYIDSPMNEEVLRKMQEELCEDATEVIAALVGDNLDRLKKDAIGSDGLGHFLSSYDSDYVELDTNTIAFRN